MTFWEVMRGTLTSVCEAVLMAIAADTSTFSSFAATTTASLGDFDNLQPYQLNLGAAVLQHLLSCGQHLILDNDITIGRDAKCPFHQSPRVFFIAHSAQEEHICKQHTDWLQPLIYHSNNWQKTEKSQQWRRRSCISSPFMSENKWPRRKWVRKTRNTLKSDDGGGGMTLQITHPGVMLPLLTDEGLICHPVWK